MCIHIYSLPVLRVILSPGGIAGNVLLDEQVYVPLSELVNGATKSGAIRVRANKFCIALRI